jgi:hypothetical protein
MTNLVVALTIGATGNSKRVLWDITKDGTAVAQGIQRYAVDYPGNDREKRDISLADGLVDACRSVKGRLESENLVAANLVIVVPSSRLVEMINNFTSWGRSSAFKDDMAERIITALDPLPMKISAVLSRNRAVSEGAPTKGIDSLADAGLDFDQED